MSVQLPFCLGCNTAHEGPCQPAQQPAKLQPALELKEPPRAKITSADERFMEDNTNIKPCPRCRDPTEKNGQFQM